MVLKCIVKEVESIITVNQCAGTMNCTGAPEGRCTLTINKDCNTSLQKGLRLVPMEGEGNSGICCRVVRLDEKEKIPYQLDPNGENRRCNWLGEECPELEGKKGGVICVRSERQRVMRAFVCTVDRLEQKKSL